MGAGIVLFITLIVLLIRGKLEGKTGFLLFLVVIIMIGYPTIQKLTVSDDEVSIETYSNEITKNPEDSVAASKLNALLDKSGVVTTLRKDTAKLALAARALSIAASARVMKDDIPGARAYLAKANVLAPNSADVRFVQQHLATVQSNATPEQKMAAKNILQQRFITPGR